MHKLNLSASKILINFVNAESLWEIYYIVSEIEAGKLKMYIF